MTSQEFIDWRTSLALTQDIAAKLLGVSKYHVCKVERGTLHVRSQEALLCTLLRHKDIRKYIATLVGVSIGE